MFNRTYVVFVLVCMLGACSNSSSEQKDGYNVEKGSDGVTTEFYMRNKTHDGLYIQYLDSATVYSLGTYKNGKRDGIWSEVEHGKPLTSVCYSNGEELVKYVPNFYFQIFKQQQLDFVFFIPGGWGVNDDLAKAASLEAYSKKHYKGQPPPALQLARLEDKGDIESSEGELQKLLASKVHDKTVQQINREGNTMLVQRVEGYDTVVNYIKVIHTQTGYYYLNLQCSLADDSLFKHLYTTVQNSFTPLSEISPR